MTCILMVSFNPKDALYKTLCVACFPARVRGLAFCVAIGNPKLLDWLEKFYKQAYLGYSDTSLKDQFKAKVGSFSANLKGDIA